MQRRLNSYSNLSSAGEISTAKKKPLFRLSFSNPLRQGYVLDEHNVRCVNIDECAIMHGVCGNGTCIDVPGSFTCKCDPGVESKLYQLGRAPWINRALDSKGRGRGFDSQSWQNRWVLHESGHILEKCVIIDLK